MHIPGQGKEGINAADRGELIEHEDVGKLIDSWLPAPCGHRLPLKT
jgi:predicted transcriptional regulator